MIYDVQISFPIDSLLIHFSIAKTAREALDTPRLLQRLEHFTAAHLATFEADIAKQL